MLLGLLSLREAADCTLIKLGGLACLGGSKYVPRYALES